MPLIRLVVVCAVAVLVAGCALLQGGSEGDATPPCGSSGGGGCTDVVTDAPGSSCGSRAVASLALPFAVADLDRDGRDDLVAFTTSTASGGAKRIAVLRGGRTAPDLSAAVEADRVEVVDLDGDGVLDLVTARASADDTPLSFLRGRGDGTFAPPSALKTRSSGGASLSGWASADADLVGHDVRVADVSGDGVPDLVTVRWTRWSRSAYVALGRGDGTFEHAVAFGPVPNLYAAGDMDGDGRTDLVILTDLNWPYSYISADDLAARPRITVWMGRSLGDGTFAALQPLEVEGGVVEASALADLDGDGRVDLALVVEPVQRDGSASRLAVLYGGADGFEAPAWFHFPGHALRLRPAHLTGGRRPDLLATVDTGRADYSGEGGVILLAAVGARRYAAAEVVHYPTVGAEITTGDLDGDRRDEIVVVTATSVATIGPACAR